MESNEGIWVCFKDVFSSHSFMTLKISILAATVSITQKTLLTKQICGAQLCPSANLISQSIWCAPTHTNYYRAGSLGTEQSTVEDTVHQKVKPYTLK